MNLTSRKWAEASTLGSEALAFIKPILQDSASGRHQIHEQQLQSMVRRLRDCVALLTTFDLDPHRNQLLRVFLRTYHALLSSIQSRESVSDAARPVAAPSIMSSDTASVGDLGPLAGSIHPPSSISTRWSDICGAATAVAALKQAVVLPQTCPHLFTASRRPWKCILLYGPPGTGKTMLAAAAASEANATFISVSSSDLLSKWVGDSEKLIRELFTVAVKFSRCIVFLDEIDSLCSSRGTDGESESARRIKTEFLIRIQAIVSVPQVTVIAATNLPWALDSAFRRRFDRFVFVGLPNAADRKNLVQKLLHGVPHRLSDEVLHSLCERLDGYSGSDITHIVHHAVMNPMNVLESARFFRLEVDSDGEYFLPCTSGNVDGAAAITLEQIPPNYLRTPHVSEMDFDVAFESFPRSVTAQDLAQYSNWEKDNK